MDAAALDLNQDLQLYFMINVHYKHLTDYLQ